MGPYCLVPSLPQQLHDAATTGNGGIFLPHGQTARVTLAIQGAGTISTGVLSIEEAYWKDLDGSGPDPVYAGTWSVIQSVTLTALTGGAQQVVHVTGSVWALRARITTNVTGSGGSVSVWAWGN
jgi:hypothetical protein